LLITKSSLLIGEATFKAVLSSPFFSGLLIKAETPGESSNKLAQRPIAPHIKNFQRPLKISFQALPEWKVKKSLVTLGNQYEAWFLPPPVTPEISRKKSRYLGNISFHLISLGGASLPM